MPPHQQRVIEELDDLQKKVDRLQKFFETEIFKGLSSAERGRLESQCDFMVGYAGILIQRIAAFQEAN